MTDWTSVRRDIDDSWETSTGRVPRPVFAINGSNSYAEWDRAAEFCRAVADAMQAESETEDLLREAELQLKLVRICTEAHLMENPIEMIIRTVREHDA